MRGMERGAAPSADGLDEILGLIVHPWAYSWTAPPPLGRKGEEADMPRPRYGPSFM